MDDKIVTAFAEDKIDDYFTVEDESEFDYDVTFDVIDDTAEICVLATDIYENESQECMQYDYYELTFNYDYANLSLEDIITLYLDENYLNAEDVAYFYYNTVNQQQVLYNESTTMLAASTIKVPLVMGWTNSIEEGTVNEETALYYSESLYEASMKDLYYFYPENSYVPLTFLMEHSIVYSDNTAANILLVNYTSYACETFREWFVSFSDEVVPESFYSRNQMNASMMLNVMKTLYDDSLKYADIIENMKNALPNDYFKGNECDFEVAHKYGNYDIYRHDMGIFYTSEPFLAGVFTQNIEEIASQVIADISKIMVEYNIVHLYE